MSRKIQGADSYAFMNCYNWFLIIFASALILYSARWSSMNEPIDVDLMLTIILVALMTASFSLLGIKSFSYVDKAKEPHHFTTVTVILLLLFCAEFTYYGNIPMLVAFDDYSRYASFSGIPKLHPILVTFASFWSCNSFHAYISFGKKKYLISSVLILFLFLLEVLRSQVIACLLVELVLYVNKRVKDGFDFLNAFAVIVSVICVLFLFGLYGNARSFGSGPWDSSYIETIGQYDNYPHWLPKQFMWAYSYITSPIANLNYNYIQHVQAHDLLKYLSSILPDFIGRMFSATRDYRIVVSVFTVATGFAQVYVTGGVAGILLFVMIYLMITYIILSVAKDTPYYTLIEAILCMLYAMMFFTNSVNYSPFSFVLFYPLVGAITFRLGLLGQ